jgi:hypothetical protein
MNSKTDKKTTKEQFTIYFLQSLLLIFVSLLIGTTIVTPTLVNALTIRERTALAIDTSLIREDDNFNVASRVLVTPIFLPDGNVQVSDDEIYEGIYYYTIDRLGFADLPYHYIVTENGTVYEGNSGKDERQIAVSELGNDMIIVGYVTSNSATRFTNKSRQPLIELLAEITSKNAITPDRIFVDGITFLRNQTTRSVSLTKKNLFGNWQSNLEEIKQAVIPLYNPINKSYSAEVISVTPPITEVEPGSEVTVSVTVRNTSNFGFYSTSSSDLIATKTTSGISQFFLNRLWLSTTQFAVLGETDVLQPGQEATFQVAMRAPLYIGRVSEEFELRTAVGERVTLTPFTVSLTMRQPTKPIIEVLTTETGTLNVRTEDSSVAQVVTQVSEGQRFFVEEESETGWIRIDLGAGETGWIAGWYVRRIE